jgi:RNA polymerase sigma-70 factor (ECF subfamily)
LPEPLLHEAHPPDRDAELASDLSMAFLVLLERLGPEERAAFLLHDVFECSYADVARILDKSEAACRQTVSRARDRIRREEKRFEATAADKEALLRRFLAAVDERDEQALLALFAPDSTWTADGGGRVAAAPRPIVGSERIARLVLGLKKTLTGLSLVLGRVNGEPGIHAFLHGRLSGAMAFEVDGGRIAAVYAVVNPDKLPVTDDPPATSSP